MIKYLCNTCLAQNPPTNFKITERIHGTCEQCTVVHEVDWINRVQVGVDLSSLDNTFRVNTGKTLKTTLRNGVTLEQGIHDATMFVNYSTEYTRVEFPFNKCYYVVAKLKEGK